MNYVGKEVTQAGAQKYLEKVFGLPTAVAIRVTTLVELAGGWSAFVSREKEELLGKTDENNSFNK